MNNHGKQVLSHKGRTNYDNFWHSLATQQKHKQKVRSREHKGIHHKRGQIGLKNLIIIVT
ncbi:MAG TPA: hypothetical protein VFX43_00590 [Chitinophagaceae bacterium]|nr:hypothetical protein [Chitinophagaceae bacterium]